MSESCRASHTDIMTRISIVRSHRGSEQDYLCVSAKLYARRQAQQGQPSARPNQAALVSVIRYCHASNITSFSEKALSATLTVYSPHIHLKLTSYSPHIHPHVTILRRRQLTEAAEAAKVAEAAEAAGAAELRQRQLRQRQLRQRQLTQRRQRRRPRIE